MDPYFHLPIATSIFHLVFYWNWLEQKQKWIRFYRRSIQCPYPKIPQSIFTLCGVEHCAADSLTAWEFHFIECNVPKMLSHIYICKLGNKSKCAQLCHHLAKAIGTWKHLHCIRMQCAAAELIVFIQDWMNERSRMTILMPLQWIGCWPFTSIQCEKLINKQIKPIEIVMANATQETVRSFVCLFCLLQNSFHGERISHTDHQEWKMRERDRESANAIATHNSSESSLVLWLWEYANRAIQNCFQLVESFAKIRWRRRRQGLN